MTDVSDLQFNSVRADVPTHPWRRYFARMFDLFVVSAVILFPVALVGFLVAPDATERWLAFLSEGYSGLVVSNVVSVLLAWPALALLQAFVGTPGKWLMGIRVLGEGDRRLTLSKSLTRETLVAVKGLGLAIPLLSLVTMLSSKSKLQDDGITSWDRQVGARVVHAPTSLLGYVKTALAVSVVLAALLYNYFSTLFAQLPT